MESRRLHCHECGEACWTSQRNDSRGMVSLRTARIGISPQGVTTRPEMRGALNARDECLLSDNNGAADLTVKWADCKREQNLTRVYFVRVCFYVRIYTVSVLKRAGTCLISRVSTARLGVRSCIVKPVSEFTVQYSAVRPACSGQAASALQLAAIQLIRH